MRSKKIFKLLEFIGRFAGGMILEAGLMNKESRMAARGIIVGPEMRRWMRRKYFKGQEYFDLNEMGNFLKEPRVRVMLCRMKKSGLLGREKFGDRVRWFLTDLGSKSRDKFARGMLPDATSYITKPSNSIVLVTFDIPEKKKRYRNWLRSALMNMDFSMMQKSVWIGRILLPTQFIRDIEDMQISSYIHIITVENKGTLYQ